MTIERQSTFGQPVGMEPTVPVGSHPNDLIECSDGSQIPRRDAFTDSKGCAHSDEARHKADVTIVADILMCHDEWVSDHCGEHGDYADSYGYIVDDASHDWPQYVKQWIQDNFDFTLEIDNELTEFICEALDGSFDCEPEYNDCEYAVYSGDGCCLWGFDIGEYENQIEISSHDELQVLHDKGILNDIIDDVCCDVSVWRWHHREKNEETGRYENVGRTTYDTWSGDCPCLMTYHYPGGRWDWIVSYERMRELYIDAIINHLRKLDRKN